MTTSQPASPRGTLTRPAYWTGRLLKATGTARKSVPGTPDDPVFPARAGHRPSRDAIGRLVAEHTRAAMSQCPSLQATTVWPHTLRRSAAMALPQPWITSARTGCRILQPRLGSFQGVNAIASLRCRGLQGLQGAPTLRCCRALPPCNVSRAPNQACELRWRP
jgi:hypothetical protein